MGIISTIYGYFFPKKPPSKDVELKPLVKAMKPRDTISLSESDIERLGQIASWYEPLSSFQQKLKIKKVTDHAEPQKHTDIKQILENHLSENEQKALLKILDWTKSLPEFEARLSERDDNQKLTDLAVEYSMRVMAYTKWLKDQYGLHRASILSAVKFSIDETKRLQLEQKHKTTGTLVESISGASFPIDLGWWLTSVSSTSLQAFLSIFAVGITAATSIFVLAMSFGIVVYLMVAKAIQKEEEKALLEFAMLSRLNVTMKEMQKRTIKEMRVICKELGLNINEGNDVDLLQNLKTLPAYQTHSTIKKLVDKMVEATNKEIPFKSTTKTYNRPWYFINPLLVGVTLFGGLFFGLYSSVTSILTMVGFTAAATFLSGGIVLGVIGFSILLISAYFAWKNYQSLQSLKQRKVTLQELEKETVNQQHSLENFKDQLNDLKDIRHLISSSSYTLTNGTSSGSTASSLSFAMPRSDSSQGGTPHDSESLNLALLARGDGPSPQPSPSTKGNEQITYGDTGALARQALFGATAAAQQKLTDSVLLLPAGQPPIPKTSLLVAHKSN